MVLLFLPELINNFQAYYSCFLKLYFSTVAIGGLLAVFEASVVQLCSGRVSKHSNDCFQYCFCYFHVVSNFPNQEAGHVWIQRLIDNWYSFFHLFNRFYQRFYRKSGYFYYKTKRLLHLDMSNLEALEYIKVIIPILFLRDEIFFSVASSL